MLTLRSGESSLRFVLGIVDDVIPEIDENFDLQLTSPTGGVTLGSRQSVTITVLNNDNAHGLIGFAEVSKYIFYIRAHVRKIATMHVTKINMA